jgi:acetyl-CoA C-acetyltransferase
MFEQVAAEYDARYGLDAQHLRAIGELNLHNAKRNPNAQTRDWKLGPEHFSADDEANPVVAGRLRRNDCCQITDGGAGIVLVSDRWLAEHGRSGQGARIAGWGHRTVGLPIAPKLARSRGAEFVMPHVREAITDAWARAGIAGHADLDGIETHDCMTPSEYMAIDHFGLTAPGQSWKAVEEGVIAPGGATPVNASGGLMGGGHPVGATGIRMLVDASMQVQGDAGEMQIEGAQRMATLNIGGSTATTVSFVVERGRST